MTRNTIFFHKSVKSEVLVINASFYIRTVGILLLNRKHFDIK